MAVNKYAIYELETCIKGCEKVIDLISFPCSKSFWSKQKEELRVKGDYVTFKVNSLNQVYIATVRRNDGVVLNYTLKSIG